ncbi:MAG: ral secretion pathway protein [Candidatus Binatota bacterium]|jgi:general secretion pathway protein A|nr:ral secretion pathway protein [Candidatus Binatota bacterium]
MYKEFWKLSRYPFENTPDPEFFYSSPVHREALEWVTYGIQERKGAVVLTGDVGCGKTLVSRRVIRELSPDEYELAVVVNPSLSPVDLLREILFQLGAAKAPRAKVEILHELNSALIANHQARKHTVIFIDEAQAIKNAGTLEELRLLLNFQLNDGYLLTLVLVGQPEWAERLAVLPQLEQRIAVHYNLRPLELAETEHYVQHRLRIAGAYENAFTPEALRAVHASTGGIPRRINTLCDRSLMVASQRGEHRVDESLVRRLAAR